MKRFKCVNPPTEASWVETLYHGQLIIRKGIAETNDPLSEIWLRNHGFVELIEKGADVPAQAPPKARSRKAASETVAPTE